MATIRQGTRIALIDFLVKPPWRPESASAHEYDGKKMPRRYSSAFKATRHPFFSPDSEGQTPPIEPSKAGLPSWEGG
jgi:hypothetical protein